MIVIPAIDLKDGLCVRLVQGKKDDATVYSDNPSFTAKKWEGLGASLIHVVDLDGAFTGKQKNLNAIKTIVSSVSIPVQVGGGIRDIGRIESLLSLGVWRVILGTVAVENPDIIKEATRLFPDRIVVGIDAKDGFVAIKGWVEVTKIRALDLARKIQDFGVSAIVYTDISRDGMLTGPNIETTRQMVDALQIPVIASGGVSSIKDIERLMTIKNLWGVITGKALYSGAINLEDAIRIASSR
ncbi:MAG: 1-(5-phosphoribosyl)-5-[(5-phosphoribosylamino)methylideneamino]imidazole-4-carboxamide isomerase [Thermodesulfovibrionales bacterium]|nr:1-(5-phosphoribosyl)-5-[(5-phosphoribosylamino)methylideneamino]imidazole-4-carboxamide isomerase [Thermodesulfovibrionales bacterium]